MLSIIKELRSDSGKNFKKTVLANYAENEQLRTVLSLTYSPLVRFGLKNIPEYSSSPTPAFDLDDALVFLTELAERKIPLSEAKRRLPEVLSLLSEDDAEVVKLILGKSLKIGCETSTINSVLGKNFIKDAPYMGANPFNKKKVERKFEREDSLMLSQLKVDGRYANVTLTEEGISLESRQGLPNYFSSVFDSFLWFLEEAAKSAIVLNGEIIIKGVSRYTSNGIISSLVSIGDKILNGNPAEKELKEFEKRHGDTYERMLSQLKFIVWDYIPYEVYLKHDKWEVRYIDRLSALQDWVNEFNSTVLGHESLIEIVETKKVGSYAEAMAHYLEMRARGEEGTVLKDGDSFWQDGKRDNQIKFKHEIMLDLRVVDYKFGEKGKANENKVSTLIVESEDGMLRTAPTNMSQKVMNDITSDPERILGKIVEVKCSGISQDREGSYSTLHPQFSKFRDDKDISNTLEECIKIDKAAKSIGV